MNSVIPGETILFVDDEPNVLSGIRRQLHKQFNIVTAEGPHKALEIIRQTTSPFAVIVADMRMPEINGVELLKQVASLSPNTVRMMLTGNADQQTAIDAINFGNILRFLNKPCSPEQLILALEAGIRQYRLVVAERELLEKTLRGSIRILTEILSMVDPEGFGRSEKIRRKIKLILPQLQLARPWEVDMAAMLAPLGSVTIPHDLIIKQANEEPLLANERQVLESVPLMSHKLLQNIPRLGNVAKIILYQNKNYDGSGYPYDEIKGDDIPQEARLLRVLTDLIQWEECQHSATEIVSLMRRKAHLYDPHLLDLALGTLTQAKATVRMTISVFDLHVGMILASDVCMLNGALLIRGGQIISNTIKARLLNYYASNRIQKQIEVLATDEQVSEHIIPDNTKHQSNAQKSPGNSQLVSDDGYIG